MIGLLLAAACTSTQPPATTPESSVAFHTPQRTVMVRVEIADDPDAQRRGLMFRDFLAPGTGMLFVFSAEEVQRFWMKDTPISLDMIFISRAGTVVGIVHDAAPFTLETRQVNTPSRYVVEAPGGFARKMGIEVGSEVTFLNVPTTKAAAR